MRRVFRALVLCALPFCARAMLAQAAPPGAAAKRAAQTAVGATNQHIAAEQRPDAPPPVQLAKNAPSASSAPAPSAPAPSAAAAPASPQQKASLTVATRSDTTLPPTMIMRELFAYERNGRRDPFFTLLMTSELRPTMSDLKLTTIIYDVTGRHSLAVLRDLGTNEQYRVGTGAVLGRMRVSTIRPKVIVFTIDEFGTNRQDSLVLGDTTKARAR